MRSHQVGKTVPRTALAAGARRRCVLWIHACSRTSIAGRSSLASSSAPRLPRRSAERGREIARALEDFLRAAAGRGPPERVAVPGPAGADELARERAELLAYVGHDGFMDQGNPAIAALLAALPARAPGGTARPALAIACASRAFFAAPLRRAGAVPWLTTTGLLAAEAYTREAAMVAWAGGGGPDEVREAAARAYAKYQRCSLRAARRLFGAPSRPVDAGRAR